MKYKKKVQEKRKVLLVFYVNPVFIGNVYERTWNISEIIVY